MVSWTEKDATVAWSGMLTEGVVNIPSHATVASSSVHDTITFIPATPGHRRSMECDPWSDIYASQHINRTCFRVRHLG